MSIRFARNVKRPKLTEVSMLAPAMIVSPLEADAMEGLGVTRLVVATALNMEPMRAGTIEVRSWSLHELATNIRA